MVKFGVSVAVKLSFSSSVSNHFDPIAPLCRIAKINFRKVYNLKYDTLRKVSCKIIHDVAEFVKIYEKKVEKYLHIRLCDSGFYTNMPLFVFVKLLFAVKISVNVI